MAHQVPAIGDRQSVETNTYEAENTDKTNPSTHLATNNKPKVKTPQLQEEPKRLKLVRKQGKK